KQVLEIKGPEQFLAAEFSPDGKKIVASASQNEAHVWDAETGIKLASFKGHIERYIQTVHFDNEGKRVLCLGQEDSNLWVWDAQTGDTIQTIPNSPTYHAAFSPNGQRIASCGDPGGPDKGSVRLWDASTGKLVSTVPHPGGVLCVAFSADGARLATAG